MEDFPFADADAGVTALVGLVTVMTTEVLHVTVIRDGYLINGKEAEAFTAKTLVRLLSCVPACFGETVLA